MNSNHCSRLHALGKHQFGGFSCVDGAASSSIIKQHKPFGQPPWSAPRHRQAPRASNSTSPSHHCPTAPLASCSWHLDAEFASLHPLSGSWFGHPYPEQRHHTFKDCCSCFFPCKGARRRGLSGYRTRCNHGLKSSGLTFPLPFAGNQLVHDLLMGVVTAGSALVCLRFFDELAKRDVFDKKVSRKLVHITIGLVFMLHWPLFSNGPVAPYIAALAPAMNGMRMLAIGLGILENEAVVKAMTREGNPRELLKGPFYYAMTILLATICFWRTSPVGSLIISNLCAGDGFADLIGRRMGNVKLPYNSSKSYIGSFAMLLLGFLFSVGFHFYFAAFGYYQVTLKVIVGSFIVSLASTIVESLPINTELDDNFTVPFTSFLVGSYIFFLF